MKLIHLSMQNIGAFYGKANINFASLGEIFLISGNTGSGKTTIFDSVTFALYGKLSGARKKLESKRLRSDFATDEEEAFVELVFSINQEVYKVFRSIPKPYIKRDGSIGFKNSSAVLYKKEESTSGGELNFSEKEEWSILADSTDPVNERIQTLVGLNDEEFTRIVLLPQGAFSDFLKLSSNERKDALSKLFPIELYASIIDIAKNKSASYSTKIQALETRIRDLKTQYDEETYTKLLQSIKTDITENKNQKVAYNEKLKEQIEENQKQENIHTEIKKRLELENKYTSVMSKQPEIEETSLIVKNAKQALVVQSEIRNVKQTKKQYDETQQRYTAITADLTLTQETCSILDTQKDQILNLEEDVKKLDFALQDIRELQESAKLYTKLLKEKDVSYSSLENKKSSLESILADSIILQEKVKNYSDQGKKYNEAINSKMLLEKKLSDVQELYRQCSLKEKFLGEVTLIQNKIKNLSEEIERIESTLETAKNTLTDFEHERDQNLIENEASLLAQKLEDGMPCPVCGSLSHPRKASAIVHTVPLDEKIASQKKIIAIAENDLKSKYSFLANNEGQLSSLNENLSNITVEISLEKAEELKLEIEQELSKCNEDVSSYKKAVIEHEQSIAELNTLNGQADPLSADINKLSNSISLIEQDIQRYYDVFMKKISAHHTLFTKLSYTENQLTITSFPEDVHTRLKEIRQVNSAEIDHFNQKLRDAEERKTNLLGQENELAKTVSIRNSEFEEARNELEKALSKTDFTSIEDAQASFIEENQIARLEENILSWNKEKDALLSLIENSKKNYPQSIEAVREKLHECEETIISLKDSIHQIEQKLENKQTELTTLENTQKQIASYDNELLQLQKEGEKFIKLNILLSNQNPKKLPLDAWVLGLYLEEITQFASSRLNRISDGRYTLLLKTEEGGGKDKTKGLDLEIFDSFTGKKRPCATLSGGETFMASISLALALTDVVQSKAGGVNLDSLFIDEGFGSLDDASLEKALSILDEIREKRMVGIISHVGDLKSRISSQILVTKGQNGSTISIQS